MLQKCNRLRDTTHFINEDFRKDKKIPWLNERNCGSK